MYWAEVERLDISKNELSIILYMFGDSERILFKNITISDNKKSISADISTAENASEYHLRLT